MPLTASTGYEPNSVTVSSSQFNILRHAKIDPYSAVNVIPWAESITHLLESGRKLAQRYTTNSVMNKIVLTLLLLQQTTQHVLTLLSVVLLTPLGQVTLLAPPRVAVNLLSPPRLVVAPLTLTRLVRVPRMGVKT